ncbi:hypothetical protein [Pelagibius sp.]|uniref:hypothetical protein n=1 Tax=Pelagibius sp. TaxID=1931238 RepID=UPI0026146501|nr:hypothetical protein [Pelagibius sp.]
MRWLPSLCLVFALLLLLPLPASAQAAEEITLRGGLHPGYGRLVFDWPRTIDYEVRIAEGKLIVSFAEEAAFAGSVVTRGLRGYAAAPDVAKDGRSLSFDLNGDVDLKHFRLGSKVVIDLRPAAVAARPDEGGEDRAVPAQGEAAADLPQVRVRGGRHADYSRLVFDWPEPVESRVEESADAVRLRFERPARFDISAVRPEGLPQVAGLTVTETGVTVALPRPSRVKLTRSGSKTVLDIYAAAGPQAAKDGSEPNPAERGQIPKNAPAASAGVVDLSPRPAETPPSAAPAGEAPTSLVPESMGGAAQAAPRAAAGDRAPESPKAPASAASEGAEKTAAGQKAAAEPEQGDAAASGAADFVAAATARTRPIDDAARGRLRIDLEPVLTFESSSAQGPTADRFVPVVLTFSWDRPTAAAAFRRGPNLWLLFDRPPPRNLVKSLAAGAPHLGPVRLIEDGEATVIVIGALPTVAPRLTREENSWQVDLRPRNALPQKALAAPVVEKGDYARVRFPLSGARRGYWVTDPDAGDRMVVVPTRGAGMGLALGYTYPQFRSLPSQQGVVLQPLTSSLEVAVVRTGVLVRDANGLLVSGREQRRRPGTPGSAVESRRLFDLEAWRRGSLDDFQQIRGDLMRAMVGADRERLGILRTDLARFYFAHGFDSEALGSLRVIDEEHPRLAQDPVHRLMQAASQWLIQDYRSAAAGLADASLAGEREALLWQAALASAAEDWEAAANAFALTDDLIDSYAPQVRLRLRLAAAEAFLKAGDDGAASLQIGALRRDDLGPREEAQINVIQGAIQLQRGNPEEARSLWSSVRDSRHRSSQARARLALIDLGLEDGSLSAQAAIEELERLRFAWRGDQFEFVLLRRLADLYAGQNRHREALHALRQAVTSFPDSPGARASAQRMREIFADIYRGPGDPAVPPLRALALYQEFRELTPAGPAGDRIIAALADRLVEVDLLDRAAELLDGQVRYRLEGEDKARIGARLALVHLLDRKPEASLAALDASDIEAPGEELRLQRQQLRARAFAELDRAEEALKMLAGDESLDAETLRADIHWRLRRWPEAVSSLSNLIPLLPPRRPMTVDESQLVVNLAVALMLSNQAVELEDLDRRYGAAMAEGPHSDTFTLLVGDGEKAAITSIADELSKVGRAQDFMANYRERIRDGELSQVN